VRIGFIEVGRSMDLRPGRKGPVRNDALNLFIELEDQSREHDWLLAGRVKQHQHLSIFGRTRSATRT
jgi:hypothetical protein